MGARDTNEIPRRKRSRKDYRSDDSSSPINTRRKHHQQQEYRLHQEYKSNIHLRNGNTHQSACSPNRKIKSESFRGDYIPHRSTYTYSTSNKESKQDDKIKVEPNHDDSRSPINVKKDPKSPLSPKDKSFDYSKNSQNEDEPVQKQLPDFNPTGLLASETSLKSGIVLKHTPPSDSRKPDKNWRLYMFKDSSSSHKEENKPKVYYIHRSPTYIFGKETRVADIPLLHPTISKQHAVLQFRIRNEDIRPYIIDLESTNGTYLNDEKLEPCRYYEMREKDNLRFGRSTREFVLLHTDSVNVEKLDYATFLESSSKL